MTIYNWKEHGFVIIKDFFSEDDRTQIASLTKQNVISDAPNTYANFSVSHYDVVKPGDIKDLPALARLSACVQEIAGTPMSFFNSAYFELHANEIDSKPGLGWHQDTPSFSILEKGTPAVFCWTMFENGFEDQAGTLEFIRREKVRELMGFDLHERCVNVLQTERMKAYGINLTDRGKFLLHETLSNQILAFFDDPLEKIAERPCINVGDLVVCNKDIMHRSAPTTSKTGMRSALTLRFVDPDAIYNGCLDGGIPLHLYNVYRGSKLWQRLYKEGRGSKICT